MWTNLIFIVLAVDRCEHDAHSDSNVCLLSLSSQLVRDARVDSGTETTDGLNVSTMAAEGQPSEEESVVGATFDVSHVAAETVENVTAEPVIVTVESAPTLEEAVESAPTLEEDVTEVVGIPEAPSVPPSLPKHDIPPPHVQEEKARAKANDDGGGELSLKPEGFVGFPKDNPKSTVKNTLADQMAMAKQLGTTVSAHHGSSAGPAKLDNVLQTMFQLGQLIKNMPDDNLRLHSSRKTEQPTPAPYAHTREFQPFGIWQPASSEIPTA